MSDIPFTEHDIYVNDSGGTTCKNCGRTWKRQPAGSACPGVKVYSWDDWSHGLMTKNQLSDAGYSVGKTKLPPVAGVIPRGKSPDGYLRLYDPEHAQKKRKLAPATLEALERGREGWKCERCGYKTRRYKDKYCRECEHLVFLENAHKESIKWAKEILEDDNVVILDTETADLGGDIIEIAIINNKGDVLIDTRIYTDLVAPGAFEVHGISVDDLKNAPQFEEVYPQIKQTLDGKHLLVYNFNYDMEILVGMADDHGLEEIQFNRTACVMEWFAQYIGNWSHKWQSFTWQRLPYGNHSALSDCRGTLRLIREMAEGNVKWL